MRIFPLIAVLGVAACGRTAITDPARDEGPQQVGDNDTATPPEETEPDPPGEEFQCPSGPLDENDACLVSIGAIKAGDVPDGTKIRLDSLVVVAAGPDIGYFAQVQTQTPGTFEGIFVAGGNTVEVGDYVDVTATVASPLTQHHLVSASSATISTTNILPPAIAVTSAEIGGGTARANQLDGMLVRIGDPAVTSIGPMVLDGVLRVGTFFMPNPADPVGTRYGRVTGVCATDADGTGLEPRTPVDFNR